ncbi:hypothetical protein [Pelagibacterium limicola]|uniref:hypothetical protein n=1 Tax=Pelagibacterium limicola TaxID=2791022 RepID=UPI0018AFDBD5|nr:hypothetical protein [Pelagibacterium limicola]
MMRAIFATGFAVLALAGPSQAQSGADQLRDFLYEGRIAEGIETFGTRTEDPEAAFGLGFLTFVSGVEGLAGAFHRHGFDPERGIATSPLLGMPSTAQRRSEPDQISYGAFRDYLEAFVARMDEAHDLLLAASEDTGFAVEIDIMRIRIDIDGDGEAGETESIGAFLAQASGMPPEFGLEGALDEIPDARFAFDAADAIWLAGYSQVLAFHADFLLAHDFGDFFTAVMHRFFPGAGLPMEDHRPSGSLFMDRDSDVLIADAIAAIHTLNWPVTDRERLLHAQDRALAVIALSRRNWEAILAETDDNLEFIPSPYQTPVHEEMVVTKAMVSAWHEALDSAERILTGDLLLPHWRFANLGFDLNRYFETAERTDLVLILTGYDARPFMREGKIASAEDFALANDVFGDAIWGYMFWFN